MRRGILQPTNNNFVGGYDMEETEAHLFLHCHQFSTIWPLI